jgi:CxxC-x17-CxxC domain-containing protein
MKMPFDRNRRFDNRRGGSGGGFGGGRGGDRSFDRGPREMHKAVCSECGKECEVPFKPTEGKPVFCRECFAKKRPPRRF